MIGIIDYGMGNIQSVVNAFSRVGSEVKIVTKGLEIEKCNGLVLPGVGAFTKAMKNLANADLISPIKDKVLQGTPLLGICLGLQLLAESSEEHGFHEGLGIIPGHVRQIPVAEGYHLPHIGWNEVEITQRGNEGIFKTVKSGSAYYFVHSFMIECDPSFITAFADHGCTVNAAIQYRSVSAVQFHPEKSQTNGLRLIKNFVSQVFGENPPRGVYA